MIRLVPERSRVGPVLLVSVAAWLLVLASPGLVTGHGHSLPAVTEDAASHRLASVLAPLPSMAAGWALMVVAMMAPLLAPPIRHVAERSLRRRRARSVALFLVGHGVVWMAAGVLMLGALLVARHAGVHPWALVAVVGAATLVWQCSPARQRCINRSHHHPPLAAFGMAADRDALRFGATHGAWCVGSCWALMLLPLVLPVGHLAAMVAVTVVLLAERLEGPRVPAWGLRLPTKLFRIVVAQTRLRVETLSASVGQTRAGRADD